MRIASFISFSFSGQTKYTNDSIVSILLAVGLSILSIEGLLFLVFFVKSIIAVPILISIFYFLFLEYKKDRILQINQKLLKESYAYWRNHLLIAAVSTIIIMLFSGAGGVGIQHNDYNMNNTMLDMLMQREWPVWLSEIEQSSINGIAEKRPIVYYFGYFLVPALFGKASGWLVANIVFWLWTALHVFVSLALTLIWVVPEADKAKRLLFVILTFLFTSGLGFIGWWVKYGLAGYKTSYLWRESVVWDLPFVFTPHWHLLLWIPHHGLGAWIATLLVLFSVNFSWTLRYIGLALGSLLVVSPFGTVGVLPFFCLAVFISLFNNNWPKLFSVINILGGVTIFLCAAAFLTSNEFNFPILFTLFVNGGAWRPLYIWFLGFELGFVVLLHLIYIKQFTILQNSWFGTATVTLCLIPLLMMGDWNDWCARASIPAWLVVGLMLSTICYKWLQEMTVSRITIALSLILMMGLTSITGDLWHSFTNYKIELPKPKQFIDYDKGTVTQQRLGKKNTLFFKYLARSTDKK